MYLYKVRLLDNYKKRVEFEKTEGVLGFSTLRNLKRDLRFLHTPSHTIHAELGLQNSTLIFALAGGGAQYLWWETRALTR